MMPRFPSMRPITAVARTDGCRSAGRARRALIAVCALLVLAALAGVLAFRSSGPELVPYTSPPLGSSGVRLHVLAPAGWRAYITSPSSAMGGVAEIEFRPYDPYGWLPSALRRLLGRHLEPGASLAISVQTNRYVGDVTYEPIQIPMIPSSPTIYRSGWFATSAVPPPYCLDALYSRTDKAAFYRTRSTIVHSARLELPAR